MPDRYRFLTTVQMQKPANLALAVKFGAGLFKFAISHHVAVHCQQLFSPKGKFLIRGVHH